MSSIVDGKKVATTKADHDAAMADSNYTSLTSFGDRVNYLAKKKTDATTPMSAANQKTYLGRSSLLGG